ncbi:hypothetical protein BJ944DRAFT_227507 [Cunninghamella echinulata]|nr:hypothetical protein BJ944DRAFT_227507 [Cunninghamella echinulata]
MHSSIKYSFQDSFWSTPINNIPQFSQSITILHQKLSQSIEENNIIIDYITQRIQAEEHYASILTTTNEKKENHISTIFDRDMGASLKQCFQVVRQESQLSAQAHQSRATNIQTTALDPIQIMAKKYMKIITTSQAHIMDCIQQFEKQVQLTEKAKQEYHRICEKIKTIQPDYQPLQDKSILLASIPWSHKDLMSFFTCLQQTYQPLLGQYILDEMIDYYTKRIKTITPSSSSSLSLDNVNQLAYTSCQQLLDQGWLLMSLNNNDGKKIEDQGIPSSCQFTTQPDICFTLNIPTQQQQHQPPLSSSLSTTTATTTNTTTTTTTTNTNSNNGFWNNKKKMWSSKQVDSLSSLIHDMDLANQHYKEMVKQLEILRLENEENLFMHFEEMENLELERIQTIKQAFISMAAAFSNTIPIYKDLYDQMMLYQETLNPEKDIQAIVEQYRIGKFCPRPILYENYFYGSVNNQLFGVPLQNVVENENTHIPLLLENGLTIIESALPQLHVKEQIKIWIAPLPLDLIHKARNDLNFTMAPITQDMLKKYDVILLASVIRLYLLELPDCLVTFELYEPIKLLYANKNQDTDSHLISISKLMTTLPTVNYETLKSLLNHFQRLINMTNDTNLIQSLVYRFSHIIIRADTATSANKHDRHPHRFVRDLLEHFDILFSKEVDEGQAIHHNRQQQQKQQRMTATTTTTTSPSSRQSSLDNYNSKLPSLDSSSMTSTLSSVHRSSLDDIMNLKQIQQHTNEQKKNEIDQSPPSSVKDTKNKSSSSAPKRSFLSYVKRSSTLPYNDTTTTTGFKLGPSLSRSKSTTTAMDSSSRRPMLIPSRSTLFEDPDMDITPPPSSEFIHHNKSNTPNTKHYINNNNNNNIIPNPSLSKTSAKSLDDNDDHISIDSFFL